MMPITKKAVQQHPVARVAPEDLHVLSVVCPVKEKEGGEDPCMTTEEQEQFLNENIGDHEVHKDMPRVDNSSILEGKKMHKEGPLLEQVMNLSNDMKRRILNSLTEAEASWRTTASRFSWKRPTSTRS